MNDRGLRYNIVTSNATNIVALVLAVLMWLATGITQSYETWGGLLVTVVVAYTLFLINDHIGLLRIRSRLVSSVFLLLMGALTFFHPLTTDYLPEICWVIALSIFVFCYQNYHSQGYIFHVFLFISISSLAVPKMLFFVPFLLLSTIVQMRAFTLKVFTASMLGIALPIAVREAYLVFRHSNTMLPDYWRELTYMTMPDYTVIDEQRLVSFAVITLISVIAIIHFACTKFNDKIRTRMLYYVILLEELAIVVLLLAFPDEFDVFFRLFIINSTPLIAHNLAFVKGKAGSVYFYTVLIIFGALAVYNLSNINFGIWEILHNI